MKQCLFSIPFTGNVITLVTKAKATIEDTGGTFKGDATSGSFSVSVPMGEIKGSYNILNSDTISMVITQKPMLISCNKIETKLKEYLPQASIPSDSPLSNLVLV